MNETEIKTRLGLILQGALAAAMKAAEIEYVQDFQYDETCEVPDFLVPNEKTPRAMVEVHQTQALNSFQMKTLRTITAVFEAKARYGQQLSSINVLFGDPDAELLHNNLRAMCGLFDVNIVLRRDSARGKVIKALEGEALKLAADPDLTTDAAVTQLVKKHGEAIRAVGAVVSPLITRSHPLPALLPLWRLEQTRVRGLTEPPSAGEPTYYRRCMLWSLFFSADDFADLCSAKSPDDCSTTARQQLVATRLAEVTEELDGDRVAVIPTFAAFLRDKQAPSLRSACQEILDAVPEMRWYFEDLRNSARRLSMATHFLEVLQRNEPLSHHILDNLRADTYGGITHRRCWMADLAARFLGVSHNRMNAALRDMGADILKLGNPFRQITYRSSRLMAREDVHKGYAKAVEVAFAGILTSEEARPARTAAELASRLLTLRLDGVVKLQKLDPLLLVINSVTSRLGLVLSESSVSSLVSDLAGERAVGRFEVFEIRNEQDSRRILLNAVAVHDNNGDHKSKEWGARRLATLYRIIDGTIQKSQYQEALFVLDGEWHDKEVARLYRSGWNRVVRLGDLEATLRDIFDIRGKIKKLKPKPIMIAAAEDEELLKAAEDEEPVTVKRRGE